MKSADRCDARAYGKRRCANRGVWLVTKDRTIGTGTKTALFCDEHHAQLESGETVTCYVFAPTRDEDGTVTETFH